MAKKGITAVIPCLNEEEGLKELLKQIPRVVSQVIVVDGDSKDKSQIIAKKYGAKVIVEKKRGYGLALRIGFNAARTDVIIATDGDGTYPAKAIAPMYQYFIDNKLDFLVACRFPLKNRQSMAVKNFFGNLLISSLISLFFDYQVTDVCSGMWLMSNDAWRMLEPRVIDNSWFFSNEVKIEAIKEKKIKYDEFWVELSERKGFTKVGNVWFIGLKVVFKIVQKRFFHS